MLLVGCWRTLEALKYLTWFRGSCLIFEKSNDQYAGSPVYSSVLWTGLFGRRTWTCSFPQDSSKTYVDVPDILGSRSDIVEFPTLKGVEAVPWPCNPMYPVDRAKAATVGGRGCVYVDELHDGLCPYYYVDRCISGFSTAED